MQRPVFPAPHPHAELQPLQSIEPSHSFPIHEPALASQQDPNPLIAKPWPRMREIADAKPQGCLIVGCARSIPGRPTKLG